MSELEPRVSIGKMVAKGAISNLPIIGGIINEIITELVPDRRMERIRGLLNHLEERGARLEPTPPRDSWTDPVFVDLLEDGFMHAARAGSAERLEHIAAILSGGLGVDKARLLERKFLLGLLAQLNDVEVPILAGAGEQSHEASEAFRTRHAHALS